MLTVEIKSEATKVKEGVGKKSGNAYRIVEQSGYVTLFDDSGAPKPYPTEISISLKDTEPPYKPGVYVISPQSVRAGNFGQLEFGRLVLVSPSKAK